MNDVDRVALLFCAGFTALCVWEARREGVGLLVYGLVIGALLVLVYGGVRYWVGQ